MCVCVCVCVCVRERERERESMSTCRPYLSIYLDRFIDLMLFFYHL